MIVGIRIGARQALDTMKQQFPNITSRMCYTVARCAPISLMCMALHKLIAGGGYLVGVQREDEDEAQLQRAKQNS